MFTSRSRKSREFISRTNHPIYVKMVIFGLSYLQVTSTCLNRFGRGKAWKENPAELSLYRNILVREVDRFLCSSCIRVATSIFSLASIPRTVGIREYRLRKDVKVSRCLVHFTNWSCAGKCSWKFVFRGKQVERANGDWLFVPSRVHYAVSRIAKFSSISWNSSITATNNVSFSPQPSFPFLLSRTCVWQFSVFFHERSFH